jgi:hypothetical protein
MHLVRQSTAPNFRLMKKKKSNFRKQAKTIKPPVLENRRFAGFSGSERFRAAQLLTRSNY